MAKPGQTDHDHGKTQMVLDCGGKAASSFPAHKDSGLSKNKICPRWLSLQLGSLVKMDWITPGVTNNTACDKPYNFCQPNKSSAGNTIPCSCENRIVTLTARNLSV